jgi:hypothetical protein
VRLRDLPREKWRAAHWVARSFVMSALTTFRFGALLLVLEVAYALYSEQRDHGPFAEGFLIGDCPYYAATTESLVKDGDWDLRNQLSGDLEKHDAFFALSKDGRVVPKHSTLMPLLAVPCYVAFGVMGFLIFNLVQVFLLVFGIAILAGQSPPARLLALAGYLSTPFLAYTYNFSPDILGAALVVWSYVFALRKKPILTGVLAGLAVWAKVYLALVLVPMLLIVLPWGWRHWLRCATAAIIALVPMLAINAHLFGAPWITGYDREACVSPEGFKLAGHYSRFNQPLATGLDNLLFNDKIGMLRTAPLWFLWPVGLWSSWRRRPQAAFAKEAALMLSLLINVLFFAFYDEWDASFFGNRFLFPALAIGLALQGPLWEQLMPKQKEQVATSAKEV